MTGKKITRLNAQSVIVELHIATRRRKRGIFGMPEPNSQTTHGADILPPPKLLDRYERMRQLALRFANRHPDDQSPISLSMSSIRCGLGRFPGIEREAYELLDDIALFLKAYPDRDKQLSD